MVISILALSQKIRLNQETSKYTEQLHIEGTMTIKLLCLLGILSSAACEAPPKQFCFPKQWQTLVRYNNATSLGNGTVEFTPGLADMFVDDVDEKFRTDIFSHHGVATVLVLYKEKAGYYIENNKCTKFEPSPKYNTSLCTPKTAKVSAPYLIGYKPNIAAVDYTFHLFISKAVFSAVADGSAPVALRMFETMSGEFSVLPTILFENYSPTKPDPKVFNVPNICKHSNPESDVWQTWARRPIWEMLQQNDQ